MSDYLVDPVVEFIHARLAEDEAKAVVEIPCPEIHPPGVSCAVLHQRVDQHAMAVCRALREIVARHEKWPVLVEQPPRFDLGPDRVMVETSDPRTFAMRASQQIQWMTEQEYRNRFGDHPPTAPMIRAIAKIWADHPDYPMGSGDD